MIQSKSLRCQPGALRSQLCLSGLISHLTISDRCPINCLRNSALAVNLNLNNLLSLC